MAIQPVQFNVPALSPAALLGDQRRGIDVENIIAQSMGYAFNRSLQQEAQAAAAALAAAGQTAQAERDFTSDLGLGRYRPAPAEGSLVLPGDEPIRLNTFEGPPGTRYEGQQFVTGDDYASAQQAVRMAQPLTELYGRPTRPGTTQGDLFDAAGNRLPEGQAAGLALGDVEKIRQLVAAIPGETPEIRQAAQALLAAAERDGNFSLAEEADITQGLSPTAFRGFGDAARTVREQARETRAMVAQRATDLHMRNQIIEPNGSRRDMTTSERLYTSMLENGLGPTMTEEQLAIAEDMSNRRAPRISALDLAEEQRAIWTGAQGGNPTYTAEFVNWLQSYVLGPRGEVLNEDLAKKVRDVTGGLSPTHMREFALNAATSAPYRAAFALYATNFLTASDIEDYQAIGGQFPWPITGAVRAMQELDPTFGEYTRLQSFDPGEGPALSGTEEEAATEAARSRFDSARGALEAQFRETDPTVVSAVIGAMQGDDQQAVALNLSQSAANFRRSSNDQRLQPELRNRYTALAQYYEALAEAASTDWQRFKLERDSVYIPAAGRLSQPKR